MELMCIKWRWAVFPSHCFLILPRLQRESLDTKIGKDPGSKKDQESYGLEMLPYFCIIYILSSTPDPSYNNKFSSGTISIRFPAENAKAKTCFFRMVILMNFMAFVYI